MHSEAYRVSADTWEACAATRRDGGRVVAVGTTTARALIGGAGWRLDGRTELFIRPPHRFAVVDVLLTNFHLPRSTLLLLVEPSPGPAGASCTAWRWPTGTGFSARRRHAPLAGVTLRLEITARDGAARPGPSRHRRRLLPGADVHAVGTRGRPDAGVVGPR